jgi:hypothetical protein
MNFFYLHCFRIHRKTKSILLFKQPNSSFYRNCEGLKISFKFRAYPWWGCSCVLGSVELSINVAAGFYSFVNMQINIFSGSFCQHTYTHLQMCYLLLKSPYLCVGVCGDFPRCRDPNCNHTGYLSIAWVFKAEENLGQRALFVECNIEVNRHLIEGSVQFC